MEPWLQILVAFGVVASILVVVAAPRRRGGSERRSSTGSDVASGMLGELLEIFQPSRTTLTEERERVRHDRQQAGSAAPPFGVDLDAGTAVLPSSPSSAAGPDARSDAAERTGVDENVDENVDVTTAEGADGSSAEGADGSRVEGADGAPSERD